MSFKIVITESALRDEIEAYNYYESALVGLGERFIRSLENRYAALSNNPQFYSFSDHSGNIRDVAVDGFPYVIIYEIIEDRVIVFSIHNTYQRPGSI